MQSNIKEHDGRFYVETYDEGDCNLNRLRLGAVVQTVGGSNGGEFGHIVGFDKNTLGEMLVCIQFSGVVLIRHPTLIVVI